jgi:O-antigen/teichoic acid export membrane protein
MTERSLRERTLRGALWASAGGNGAQVLAFVLFILVSRVVGPSAFGVVAVGLLLLETLRALTVESVGVNLVANGNLDRSEFNAGFALTFASSALGAIVLTFAAPLLAALFNVPSLTTVLPLLAPLLVLHAAARLYEAELSLRMRFAALAARSIGATAIGGAVGLAAAYAGQGVNALILQQWVSLLCALLLMAAQAEWRPGLEMTRDQVTRLARQSVLLAPAGVLVNLKQTIDGLAVATFFGATAAGAYNLAKRTRLAFQQGFSAAIGRVSLPAFGAVKDDPVRLASAVEQAAQLGAVVAFPIFVGVAAVSPEMIAVFLGPEWAAAAAPMAMLMISGALAVTTRLFENALIICDQRRLVLASNVAALFVLASLIALFGRIDPAAVASSTVAVALMQNLVAWTMASRLIKLRFRAFAMHVWMPLAICLLMLAFVAWLRTMNVGAPAWQRLVLLVPAGAAFYAAASWFLNRGALMAVLRAARVVMPRRMMRT